MIDKRKFLIGGATVPLASLLPSIVFAEANLIPSNRLIHWAPLFYNRLLEKKVEVLPLDKENFTKVRRVNEKTSSGTLWTQRSVQTWGRISSEEVIALADNVAQSAGRHNGHIQFGYLFIPSKGLISASRHEYRKVTMREISVYEIATDEILTRLDVIFHVVQA